MLHWFVDQTMTRALAQMELTASQGHVMAYLCHRKEAPCAKDIEDVFQLSHPTVSGLLARLEKKCFIEFRPDEKDRRVKRIYILPKGYEYLEQMQQVIEHNESDLIKGFSAEEVKLFDSYLNRAIQNMKEVLDQGTIDQGGTHL